MAIDPRKTRRRHGPLFLLILLAMLAALALIVVNVTRSRIDTTIGTAAHAEAALPPRSARPLAPRSGPEPLPPAVPMPPIDTPISLAANALQKHADAGDTKAACRLGMELLRCQQVPEEYSDHFLQVSEQQEKSLRDKGETAMAERVAAGRRAAMDTHAACREIPKSTRDRAHHYVRQAALAGEPEAMLRYASGESMGLMGRFDRLTSPDVDAWRREAPALLQRALAAGHPEAVHLLAEAYRPADEATTSIVGWLIPNDPVQAQVYSLLQRQLSGGISPPGQRPVTDLDGAGLARAEALAENLRLRHFDGSTVDPERVVLGLPPLVDTHGSSKHAAVADRFCQSVGTGVVP